ncbi:Zinc finger C2H2-type [Trinorchestia longiramus]|nr:Zinc finger C2H2-type [Trinorchestia longiramus]
MTVLEYSSKNEEVSVLGEWRFRYHCTMLDGWPLLQSADTRMASRSSNLRKKRLGQTSGGRKLYLVNQGQTIRMQGARPHLKRARVHQAGILQLKRERPANNAVTKKGLKTISSQLLTAPKAFFGSSSDEHNSSYPNSSMNSSSSHALIQLSSLREDFPEPVGVSVEIINDLGDCLENGIDSDMMDNCILDVDADNLVGCLDVEEPTNNMRDDVSKKVKQELLSGDAFSSSAKEVQVEMLATETLLSEPSTSLQQESFGPPQEVFLTEPECQLLIKKEWVPPEEQILTAEENYSSSVFGDAVIKQEPLLDEVPSGHDPLQLIQLYVNSDGLAEDTASSGEPPPQLLQHSQFLLDDQKLTLSPVTFLSTDAAQDCSVSAAGFGELTDAGTLTDPSSLSLAIPCTTLQPVLMSPSIPSTESSAICSTSTSSVDTEFTLAHSVFSEPNNSCTFHGSSIKPSTAAKPTRKITIRSIQQTQTSPATASKFLLSREVKSSVASKMCQTSDESLSSSSLAKAINMKGTKITAIETTSTDGAGSGSIVSKVASEKSSTTVQQATPKITMVPSRRDRQVPSVAATKPPSNRGYTKVDKEDPRSRLHYVKYMKKDGKTIKKWECGMCGREFIHQYTLMRHLPTHTDERNFTCDQCGKAFRQMSTLSQHRSTHSQFRPYVCDICQKTFTRVSTLISHKKLHDGVKPHVCSVCGKAFHQKGNLKNHMFIHTNERPYKCHQCGRGFNQASNLHSHKIRAHSDSSPLVLSPADVARVQSLSDSVTSNMGLQTSESLPPLKCLQCPLTFGNKATMKRHEIAAHSKYQQLMPKRQGRVAGAASSATSLGSRRCKVGSVRMVEVPGGDEAFQQLLQGGRSSDTVDQFLADDLTTVLRLSRPARSCLLIPAIRTSALASVVSSGKTPFALLKPASSPPVVVRVALLSQSLHALLPASAAQLREASQFSVAGRGASTKAVQIKIPVVATVVEKLSVSGEASIEILAPDNEEPAPPVVKPKTYAAPSPSKTNLRSSLPTTANNGLLANVRASINTIAPKVASTSHAAQITADYLSVTTSDLPSGVLASQLGPQTLAVESDIMVQSVSDVVMESTEDVCPTTVPELLGGSGEQLVLEAYGGDGGAAGHIMHYSDSQQEGEESHLLYLRPDEQQHLPEAGLRYLRATETPLEFEMVAPDDPRLTHVVDHLGRLQPLTEPLHAQSAVGDDSNSSNTSGIAAPLQASAGVPQGSESSIMPGDASAAAAAVDSDAGGGAQFSLDGVSGNSCRITLTEAGGFTIESEGGSVSLGGDGTAMDMDNIAAIIGALQRAGLPVQLQSNSAADPSSGAAQLAVVGGSHVAVAGVDGSHMTVANVIDGSHMAVADDLSIVDDGSHLSEANEDCRSTDSHHVTVAGDIAITDDGHLRVAAHNNHSAVDQNVEDATDPNLLPSSAVPELVEDAAHAMLIAEESVITHRDSGPDEDDGSLRH